MAVEDTKPLEIAAARLRNAAPVQYSELLAVLRTYHFAVTKSCVDALEHVQVEQGRARQCAKFLDLLQKAGVPQHG